MRQCGGSVVPSQFDRPLHVTIIVALRDVPGSILDEFSQFRQHASTQQVGTEMAVCVSVVRLPARAGSPVIVSHAAIRIFKGSRLLVGQKIGKRLMEDAPRLITFFSAQESEPAL